MKYTLAWALVFIIAGAAGALGANKLFVLQDNCVKCHLWCESTSGENSVVQWKNSVHFRPDSACADCHGGDRLFSMDFQKGHMGIPGAAESVAMCEKCHEAEVRDFVNRPLPANVKKVCTMTCVDCHGHHRIEKSDGALVNARTCGACHPPDKAASLISAIEAVEARFTELEKESLRHESGGLPTETFRVRMEEIQRKYARSFHGMRLNKLEEHLNGSIQAALDGLRAGALRETPEKLRVRGLAVVGFLALLSLVLGLYLRSLQHTQPKE